MKIRGEKFSTFVVVTSLTPDSKLCNFIILRELIKALHNAFFHKFVKMMPLTYFSPVLHFYIP